jgi:hypothetical protein
VGSFAYIEFADKESVENALKLNDSLLKGRQLKVTGPDLPTLRVTPSYNAP